MEKFQKQNLENIRKIFENTTGVSVTGTPCSDRSGAFASERFCGRVMLRCATVTALLCVLSLSVLAVSKLNDEKKAKPIASNPKELSGMQVAVDDVNVGAITGDSDKEASEDVEVTQENTSIPVTEEDIKTSGGSLMEVYYQGILKEEDWAWVTVSEKLSALYGSRTYGFTTIFHDHINIAGNEGDDVYAVYDGTVLETGFEAQYGNYILLDIGGETTVKYGHLKEMLVKEGDSVEKGQTIAKLGNTGMSTGPNLSFAVYENGVAVNPVAE